VRAPASDRQTPELVSPNIMSEWQRSSGSQKSAQPHHGLVLGTQTTVQSRERKHIDRGLPGIVKKIALEEHLMCPDFEGYWAPSVGDVDPAIY
jgi:hypothetical protein